MEGKDSYFGVLRKRQRLVCPVFLGILNIEKGWGEVWGRGEGRQPPVDESLPHHLLNALIGQSVS